MSEPTMLPLPDLSPVLEEGSPTPLSTYWIPLHELIALWTHPNTVQLPEPVAPLLTAIGHALLALGRETRALRCYTLAWQHQQWQSPVTVTRSRGAQTARHLHAAAHHWNRAATSLQAKVSASMSAALQGQRLPGQALHPLPCSPAITADHAIGEEAISLTVTVSETCTAVAYDEQQMQARATQLLTTQAAHAFGAGYLLAGNVQVSVSKAVASPTSPQVLLTFSCAGPFAYTLTAQAQQHLKTLLAGQPRLSALRWLRQQPGIGQASISGVSDNQPLPDDLSHIHLLIVALLF